MRTFLVCHHGLVLWHPLDSEKTTLNSRDMLLQFSKSRHGSRYLPIWDATFWYWRLEVDVCTCVWNAMYIRQTLGIVMAWPVDMSRPAKRALWLEACFKVLGLMNVIFFTGTLILKRTLSLSVLWDGFFLVGKSEFNHVRLTKRTGRWEHKRRDSSVS